MVSTACSPWAGAARPSHWHNYESAYLLLAGLSTPLVLSVHSIISFDFSVIPVTGLARDDLPALLRCRRGLRRLRHGAAAWRYRSASRLQPRGLHHLAASAEHGEADPGDGNDRLLRLRRIEFFFAWYSGNPYEIFAIIENRTFRVPTVCSGWRSSSATSWRSQPLWFKKRPEELAAVRCSSSRSIVSVGMWLERFVIVVISLHRGTSLPSSWDHLHRQPLGLGRSTSEPSASS